MKTAIVALLACGMPFLAHADDSPIAKVVSMLSDLQAKIIKEGEVTQKEYDEFAELCEDRARNLGFEVKTGKAEVDSLKATIEEEDATIGSLTAKIEELVASASSNEKDLKGATTIRDKEHKDFSDEEKELMETTDMLSRAAGILERQMKGGASMAQFKSASNLAEAFDTMLKASLIGTGDANRLAAFAQESNKDDDDEQGAPAGEVYESQSGGVVDTLQDLLDKAETQLGETRKKEVSARNNYQQLKQSLESEIKNAVEDKDGAKKSMALAEEKKAKAEGDLEVSSKELAEDIKAKGTLHQDCMSGAATFQSETASRGEELKALAQAKKIIKGVSSGGAALDQVSFVQLKTKMDPSKHEAVRLVRDLAHKYKSGSLIQLAGKMAAAMHSSDAFEKVKALISDMITKLEKDADASAQKKAYCDKELSETNTKKDDKSDDLEKLGTKIEQQSAKSAQLKDEVGALEKGLMILAKSQAGMDKVRGEQKAAYEETSAELEKGLAAIKKSLQVLNEYYASAEEKSHDSSDGAAGGIMGLLEVVEADFSKNLAQVNADEEAAVAEYEKMSQENEIDKTTKEQDVKYKTKESKELGKSSAELTQDRTGVKEELSAVLDYLKKIEEQCIAKAETYGERAKRRNAEISGLKEALEVLESETALVQRSVTRRTLRGANHVKLSAA